MKNATISKLARTRATRFFPAGVHAKRNSVRIKIGVRARPPSMVIRADDPIRVPLARRTSPGAIVVTEDPKNWFIGPLDSGRDSWNMRTCARLWPRALRAQSRRAFFKPAILIAANVEPSCGARYHESDGRSSWTKSSEMKSISPLEINHAPQLPGTSTF